MKKAAFSLVAGFWAEPVRNRPGECRRLLSVH